MSKKKGVFFRKYIKKYEDYNMFDELTSESNVT